MKEERLIMTMLVVLGAAIAVLLFLVFAGRHQRSTLELELEADRLTARAFQFVLQGGGDPLSIDERILSFGVYSAGGEAIEVWGDAPPRLRLGRTTPRAGSSRTDLDPGGGTLSAIRATGMPRGMPMPMGRQPMRGGPAQAFLFLQMRVQNTVAARRLTTIMRIAAPLLVAVLIAVVGSLYRRNRGYRERIAAQETLAQLGEAARTLAHEIKNPLGAIRVQAAYLRRVLPEDHAGGLAPIEDEVRRLTVLADRVTSFLRDPVGRPERVDLAVFLQRFASARVDISVEGAGRAAVLFDPEKLRSVIENLVQNALESQAENGADQPVGLILRSAGSAVEVLVRDRGVGLPPAATDKLFDPFYTTKSTGSGVGLSLTRRLVEAAGGSLALRNRSGGGVEAIVRLAQWSRP